MWQPDHHRPRPAAQTVPRPNPRGHLRSARALSPLPQDFHHPTHLVVAEDSLQLVLPATGWRGSRITARRLGSSGSHRQESRPAARPIYDPAVGCAPVRQRKVLAADPDLERSGMEFSPCTHHPCLGSTGCLPYSADRGKQSMNRKALDVLKLQVPLLDYVQAHGWQQARPIGFGRFLGLCPLHTDHKPSFLVDPNKNLFFCYGCRRGGDLQRTCSGCAETQPGDPKGLGVLQQGWRAYPTDPSLRAFPGGPATQPVEA